ncbi:uncharacterized protein LOC109713597 isoform X2 [Ananas comosus]|uniref:Protein preY, mitochondrial n=1 Tax=Ananas comosus TaxID=4615 RepID=A0A6P5FBJ9_ANACO|nr:uncharacterized protein LOC109713597 isoform X2 [Ananas comosus]
MLDFVRVLIVADFRLNLDSTRALGRVGCRVGQVGSAFWGLLPSLRRFRPSSLPHPPPTTHEGRRRAEMVRACRVVLQQAGSSISKALSDFLVCPLSKKPLRYCEDSQSLISDAIGVSFPVLQV